MRTTTLKINVNLILPNNISLLRWIKWKSDIHSWKLSEALYEICMNVIDVSWFYSGLIATFCMYYPEIKAEYSLFFQQ